jgi:crossover junction endodeoxyribonuclease RuvC
MFAFGGTKMRVIGIDPGVAIVGFGVVDYLAHQLRPIQYGCITTEANEDPALRLQQIFHTSIKLIDDYKPDVMAIEKLFFNRNVTTALAVGQARGVLLLAAMERGLSIAEYTPLQVKQAIVGYGKAEKKQVQEMVRMFLKLKETPRPDDAADALAIAICHAHSATINNRLTDKRNEGSKS